jgi:hypothetical protein
MAILSPWELGHLAYISLFFGFRISNVFQTNTNLTWHGNGTLGNMAHILILWIQDIPYKWLLRFTYLKPTLYCSSLNSLQRFIFCRFKHHIMLWYKLPRLDLWMYQPQQSMSDTKSVCYFNLAISNIWKLNHIKILHIVGYQLELNVDFGSFFEILTVFKIWQSKTPKMAYLKITN